ncbi:MAG: glycosyltransferase family 39 protein [Bacteroidota bacterium]
MKMIKKYWEEKPLTLILVLAIFFRLLAVIFAKGFGWHDDHFLVIEAAQSWVDGTDYNSWLPINGNTNPSGHSFFYPGIHFVILYILKWIGMTEPQSKMMVIRLLHALLSLIIVRAGFKITEKLSNLETARWTGLMLAIYWFMPFLSVRNLVEFVNVPLLIAASWIIIKNDGSGKARRSLFYAGLFLGMAMCVRFQSVIFVIGLGTVLLFQKKWMPLFLITIGCTLIFCLFQGVNDYLLWGRPFAEFRQYVQHNVDNANNYLTNTWYSYVLVVVGILLPPLSVFLFFGFLRTWKKHAILFFPTMLFLVFHSIFPNKQERFILSIVPFIIILGAIGWSDFVSYSAFWLKRKKLLRGLYGFSISINCIALPFVTVMYSKEARVESMVYLSHDEHIRSIAMEDTNHSRTRLAPLFYLKHWIPTYEITTEHPLAEFVKEHAGSDTTQYPDYILFFENIKLDQRVADLKQYYPQLHYMTTIDQGFIDDLLHRMNPLNNVNQTVYIYKVR